MITLRELLQYFSDESFIQVVMYGHDWEETVEFVASSEFLKPFYDYLITDMGCEESCIDGNPVIRVSIKKNGVQCCKFAA